MASKCCEDIRNQVMYFIDNELSEEKRQWLVEHIDNCSDCQNYLSKEKELKSKICEKLKSSYICRCDVQRLTASIKDKINELVKS